MKRKITAFIAAVSLISCVSCGAEKDDDRSVFTLGSGVDSSEDDDNDSSAVEETEEDFASKAESEAEKVKEEMKKAESEAEKASEAAAQEASKQEKFEKEVAETEKELEDLQSQADALNSESETESSAGDEYVMGEINDNVYSNEFSGIRFKLPENMQFADSEEILSYMDMGQEMLDLGDKASLMMKIAEKTTIYDMLAKDMTTGDNFIIMYENLAKYPNINPESYTLDDYFKNIDTQMGALADSGITFIKKDAQDIKLCGMDFKKIECETTYESFGYSTKQNYYIAKKGNYIISIIGSLGMFSDKEDVSVYEPYFFK